MRQPLENSTIFKERRKILAEKLGGAALILAAPEESIRNGSVQNPFRQDSNLYYLTGFEEPQTIFLFRPGLNPESTLFVRSKNLERETWDGFRYGPEAAQEQFKMDAVYPIEEFESKAAELLKGVESLFYRHFKNREVDQKIENALLAHKAGYGRTGYGILSVHDADELLGELRVKKGEADIRNLREACRISAEAHAEVMKYLRPGMTEREIHGYFLFQIMKRGAAREGYNGIVAGGPAATTLHYVFNDQPLKAGQLVLIDCGAEYNYFTGDITRTFPVAGQFNEAQAEVYEGVLKIQKAIIQEVKPGITFKFLQEMGTQLLTDLMLELGLLTGRRDDIIQTLEHKKYYPHGIGHFLGMDVHDLGLYYDKKGEARQIEENMVFTVEPGLYIPLNDSSVAAEYRGIGIRIEDNIRVTSRGYENLTEAAPKEISDLYKTQHSPKD